MSGLVLEVVSLWCSDNTLREYSIDENVYKRRSKVGELKRCHRPGAAAKGQRV